MSAVNPLSAEFLYELYATALRQEPLCAVLARHMRKEYLPDRSFQQVQEAITTKGFFSPRNVKKVHAYGVEVKANFAVQPAKDWLIDLNGSYSWTPSINEGEKMSPADQSVGKQLPYVPKHSASLTGRLSWRTWAFLYKWAFYSERYTMSSNDYTLTGHLPEYFMSNVSLEKNLFFKPVDIQLKFAVNNLFNEDYLSVLSRPMPGINFEFFIGITPKFGKNKKKSENTNM